MGFHCKSPSDCGCVIWDYGKVNQICHEIDCMDLVETYDLNKCECGCDDTPVLYRTGTARQAIKSKDDDGSIKWYQFVGCIVECPHCGKATTKRHTPDEAVSDWNNGKSYYAIEEGSIWRGMI